MLASLAHQSRSRQLLLPCFFAKQIPTMLHEHFDDTLLFSRVEIFCSSTKRGQNLDCRLKIWSAKSGGGKRCDVTCVHRPGLWRPSIFCTQLNSRWLWHILRNKASAASILGGWGCSLCLISIDLYYTLERLQLLFVPCSLFRRLNIVKADEGGGLWPPRPPRPTAISGCKLTAHSSEPKGYEHVRLSVVE